MSGSVSGATEKLAAELEQRHALRNVQDAWLRRHAAFSANALSSAIARTDIETLTRGTIAWRVRDAHNVKLGVNVLVQLEDAIDVGAAEPRGSQAKAAASTRTLLLVLSDGGQEFVGVEWRPLGGTLRASATPGTKIVLDAHTRVRRGRVLLEPRFVRVLGAPPADIWGERGKTARIEALKIAGLPVPAASRFDTLAAQGPVIPALGIAAVALTETQDGEEAHDDGEDAFWQAAVAAVDAHISQPACGAGIGTRRAGTTAVENAAAPLVVPEREASSAAGRGGGKSRNVIMDSDDESDQEMTEAVEAVTERALHHVDDRRCKQKGDSSSMYRVFALRSRMSGDERHFKLRMTVDDGCGDGVCDIVLSGGLTDRMTGGLSAAQIVEKSRRESEEQFKAFKNSVRSSIRGLHGFALVEHGDAGDVVTAVAAQAPDGMVGRIAWLVRKRRVRGLTRAATRQMSFLSKYTGNVEHRWRHYEGTGR